MQQKSVTSVREVLEKMTTEELDELLDQELHAKLPDMDAIRMILSVLREREKDMPLELTPGMLQALENYQQKTEKITEQAYRVSRMRKLLIRIVSSAAVLILACVFLIPQKAEADSLWDWLVRVTEDVIEFFSPADTESRIVKYEFKTDNPGLQQVQDTAVEMGVNIPAVPMWLPEKFDLYECKVIETPVKTSISSILVSKEKSFIHNIDVYNQEVSHSFEKDATQVKIEEIEGTQFTIMRNNDVWVAVWGKDNIECSIFIDCQEDDLYRVLKSIYVLEGR